MLRAVLKRASCRMCNQPARSCVAFSRVSHVEKYDHSTVEKKWQQHWLDKRIFQTKRREGYPKKYILDMFPYPSGAGLHVGHPEGYTATDILARYYRMKGYDVLHPMGWDAFGLPAEQHAINTNTHPAVTTKKNIEVFKRQLQSLGFSYDWNREISTTHSDYVKWTQWIFLQIFHSGLAMQSEVSVNWCPALGTVLANEEVINGLSERGDHPVVKMPIRQWLLKITAYADELETGLQGLQWPEGTVSAQRSWIGRSEGALVTFKVASDDGDVPSTDTSFDVFTTRVDTLYGVTYVVLAPEHALVPTLTTAARKVEVEEYLRAVSGLSDLDRTAGSKTRHGPQGIFLGSYVLHPLTNEKLPIWIADYVIGGYGTSAVMAVPAHDARDYDFAKKYALPIRRVVQPVDSAISSGVATSDIEDEELFTSDGILCNSVVYGSGDFSVDGLSSAAGRDVITDTLIRTNRGQKSISYKLRDWTFSRQRFWGEPIPIYFPVEFPDGPGDPRTPECKHTIRYDLPLPVPEEDLPLELPHMDDFSPGNDPSGCLARAVEWRYFKRDGKWFARETNTMPQWAGSCWYYLRFADPRNHQSCLSVQAASDWLPVDIYVGGQEHAVLHLLYARFWHKVLHKIGVVNHPEPFLKVVHQGIILGPDGEKMSKSKGNVVNPDTIVDNYGADVLRMYEMFMGPLEATKPWQDEQLSGVLRFRDKVYRLIKESCASGRGGNPDSAINDALLRETHRAIRKVTQDIESMSFNTAISALMIYVSALYAAKNKGDEVHPKALETLVLLLSPFAPHVCEECWEMIGHSTSLAHEPWPVYEDSLCEKPDDALVTLPVQVNGKLRGTINVRADADDHAVVATAMGSETIARFIEEKNVVKKIYIPGKVLNFVIKSLK